MRLTKSLVSRYYDWYMGLTGSFLYVDTITGKCNLKGFVYVDRLTGFMT